MTSQTKRALERLPKGPLTCEADSAELQFHLWDRYHVDALRLVEPMHDERSEARALFELAARSPKLLEMLDGLLAAAQEGIQWFDEWEESNTDKHSAYASGPLREAAVAAEAILRETTRAMLGEKD